MDSDFRVDILKLYFNSDYSITDKISVHQPTLQEIIDYGENEFWNVAYTLTANPSSMKLALWENGQDWNKVNDFELFISLVSEFTPKETSIFFGDLDFSKFKVIQKEEVEEGKSSYVMVYRPDPIIQINEQIYCNIVSCLRDMLDIHPKKHKAKNKATKQLLIDEEKQKIRIAKRIGKENKNKSLLFPLISAALNHPGFKYKKNELKEIGIVEFMDSIKRLQVYEEVTSLMTGMYMGMVDLKGRDLKKDLNWARDMYE